MENEKDKFKKGGKGREEKTREMNREGEKKKE